MVMKRIAPLALAVAVGAASLPQLAWSQTAAPQAQGQVQGQQAPQREMRPSRIEGRIAFLRAELKITNAQAAAFDAVANAMRENDREMRAAFEARRQQRGQQVNVLDRLDQRQKGAEAMASATGRLKAAWGPLYASLSDDQKKTADELMAPHRGGHHMGPRRT
jgi:hypothetical protein